MNIQMNELHGINIRDTNNMAQLPYMINYSKMNRNVKRIWCNRQIR